jgi:crossover junction endodeoxyribonuclease RuvC
MINVLGIDPSLTETGCVYLSNGKIKDKYTIKTRPSDSHIGELRRLTDIKDQIKLNYDIGVVVIEGIAFSIVNTRSLVQLSALNYFIRDKVWRSSIPFVVVPPTTLKKFITGAGNSKKDMMMLEVYKRYKISFDNNNLCDAFSLAKLGEALLESEPHGTKLQQELILSLKEKYGYR